MPRDELSARERAVLFALLAAGREVSNPELRELVGVRLDGKERRELNDLRLVESTRVGRAYAHELTDAGWRWCADELAAGPTGREAGGSGGKGGKGGKDSSLARAHSLVFAMFSRYLSATGLRLADIADASGASGASGGGTDVAARIEAGYQALTPVPGEFVKLRELRLRLPDLPRPAVDAALTELYASQRVNLIPQSDQQALTDADRECALRVGGEYKHLISIER